MGSSPQNIPSELTPRGEPEVTDWKLEANERLAAHRTRRGKVTGAQSTLPLDVDEQPVRSRARVAARVAARYATAPTYREVLAQQEKASTVDPNGTHAQGITETQSQALLAGLLPEFEAAEHQMRHELGSQINPHSGPEASQGSNPGVNVKDGKLSAGSDGSQPLTAPADTGLRVTDATDFESKPIVGEWIPGNVIEFPRVLVAARKARPRLAEGPLREDATVDTDPEHSQLRIFEVEQQAISTTPEVDPVATEWSSIRLDARERVTSGVDGAATLIDSPLQAASLSDRVMAGLVDGAIVAFAFLAFVAVFVACTTHPPAGKPALIAAAATLAAFFLLYQYLFFTYSEATPGMRYAHIALCTFDDENPTRSQMRRRIGALLLSACPLALGFAWAWFDEDRLGWHDRMSRTYQRSYR